MNIPRCTGYTSLICNIKIYFIQRESQRVNIFSSINKMTALLVFGPIKNSVLVKHCPRTQWIWAFNIILNFLANTPFTFGHKKDCLYGMRHLKWNKFSPMTMHLNRKWIFQTGKIIEKLLPALISCETELLKARKWITVWFSLFAVQRNAKTMGYTKLCNEPQRSTTSHNESMTHNNHPGNRLV